MFYKYEKKTFFWITSVLLRYEIRLEMETYLAIYIKFLFELRLNIEFAKYWLENVQTWTYMINDHLSPTTIFLNIVTTEIATDHLPIVPVCFIKILMLFWMNVLGVCCGRQSQFNGSWDLWSSVETDFNFGSESSRQDEKTTQQDFRYEWTGKSSF